MGFSNIFFQKKRLEISRRTSLKKDYGPNVPDALFGNCSDHISMQFSPAIDLICEIA